MKLSNVQEEYLKTIYSLSKKNSQVRVTDIAKILNKTKPTVNYAINVLKEEGFVNYEVYGNISLTETRYKASWKNGRSVRHCVFIFTQYIRAR